MKDLKDPVYHRDNKERFFRTFLEVYDLILHPPPTGISQGIVELERHIRNGGELHRGTLFPQTSFRKDSAWSSWRDWAISVNDCLPKDEYTRKLIYECYDSAEMAPHRYRKAYGPLRKFWRQIRERKLYETGLFIADLWDKKN